jgi:hypothetical protein
MLKQVKQYNQKGYQKYQEAWKKWKPEKGGAPYLGLYQFCKDDGTPYKRGWVSIIGGRHKLHKNYMDAFNYRRNEIDILFCEPCGQDTIHNLGCTMCGSKS